MDEKIRTAQYNVNYYGRMQKCEIQRRALRKWVTVLQQLLAEKHGH